MHEGREKVERALRSGLVLAFGVLALLLASGAPAGSAAAPVNRCAPTIEGSLFVGKTIRAGTGCWSNNPTRFAYQWLRCDENGTNCVRITRATTPAYRLRSIDAGNTIVVLVTASNADGTTGPVNSKPSERVSTPTAPENREQPSITGNPLVGELLFADPGKYTGGIPSKFTYQWQRCNAAGSTCTRVAGETDQTYTVRGADVDFSLRVAVTATNDYGSDVSTSDRTGVVKTAPAKVIVTTSMVASRSVVTCCAAAKLSGTISTAKAGELITIVALPFDEIAAVPIGTTTTTEGGAWSLAVRPSIQTTFRAKTSTSTGPPITIEVHPRVGLGYHRRIFSTKVTGGSGATSFAGKVVFFQRRTAGGSWRTLDKVVLDINSIARFRVKLPRGVSFVRVYLTRAQAGAGYLDGVSHIRRFRFR